MFVYLKLVLVYSEIHSRLLQLLGGMLSEEMSMMEPTASREYVQMFTKGKDLEEQNCSEDSEGGNCESLSSTWQVSDTLEAVVDLLVWVTKSQVVDTLEVVADMTSDSPHVALSSGRHVIDTSETSIQQLGEHFN